MVVSQSQFNGLVKAYQFRTLAGRYSRHKWGEHCSRD